MNDIKSLKRLCEEFKFNVTPITDLQQELQEAKSLLAKVCVLEVGAIGEIGDLVQYSDITDVPVYKMENAKIVRDKDGPPIVLYYKTEISPEADLQIINKHHLLPSYLAMKQKIVQRNGLPVIYRDKGGSDGL